MVSVSYTHLVLDADTMISMLKKALEYKHIDENALSDVYSLASGAVSNEIGLWALDRLCEDCLLYTSCQPRR